MKTIHIDKLNIRINGIDEIKAREITNGLGPMILQQLSDSINVEQHDGAHHTNKVNVNKIKVDKSSQPSPIQKQCARQVAQTITQKAYETNSKK